VLCVAESYARSGGGGKRRREGDNICAGVRGYTGEVYPLTPAHMIRSFWQRATRSSVDTAGGDRLQPIAQYIGVNCAAAPSRRRRRWDLLA